MTGMSASMSGSLEEWAHMLPKVDLHVHLEGCVRPQTFLELRKGGSRGQQRECAGPKSLESVSSKMQVDGTERSLADYLRKIEFVYQVTQTPEALRRIAFEAVAGAAGENVAYIELRGGPLLHTRRGLAAADVIAAVLDGMHEAFEVFKVSGGFIVAALRDHPPEDNVELARVAVKFKDRGVVGFDLAGNEDGYPCSDHARAFAIAREGGLGITVHAGEAAGADSIRDAVLVLGAQRIGHGIRLAEDRHVLEFVRENAIPLEMCPTSNVHTQAVRSLAEHPLKSYLEAGVRVTINDDDPQTSRTNMAREVALAMKVLGLARNEVVECMRTATDHAFASEAEKARLRTLLAGFHSPGNMSGDNMSGSGGLSDGTRTSRETGSKHSSSENVPN